MTKQWITKEKRTLVQEFFASETSNIAWCKKTILLSLLFINGEKKCSESQEIKFIPLKVASDSMEENDFWIHFKHLEKGTILWPDQNTEEPTMSITIRKLEQLIRILGIRQKIKRQEVWKNH